MSSDPSTRAPKLPRWWIRWFPLVWWGVLLVLFGGVQYAASQGMDSDKQVVAIIALLNLAWLGAVVWLLFLWPPIKRLPAGKRWLIRLAAALMIGGGFSSIDVDYDGDSRWRAVRFAWAADPDERLEALNAQSVADGWQTRPNDYPRFLGNGYWAEAANVDLAGDWQAQPPKLLWKQPIGAGWSAFAVVGEYAVTQEQRGEEELVVCYRVSDGSVVWSHADRTRHDPATTGGGLGGIGPRATPTIHEQRVYTMGATGVANCLDARNGEVIWTHNFPAEYGIQPLLWANAGSPLVVPETNLVVFNAGEATAADGHSLLAFNRDTGALVWQGGPPTTSYASPVYAVLQGVPQVIQVNEATVAGYRTSDGAELWQFAQPGSSSGNASCSQPIPLPNDRVLVSKGYGVGSRLAEIRSDGEGFTADVVWEKKVLKTKLANLVIRDGYAYGLDHTLMSCVNINTGRVEWKKRRSDAIGHGQLLLAGDKIFALSETGEGILIECNPDRYVELSSVQMLTDEGITWNNPALAGDHLLVRNNVEAACYRLPVTSSTPPHSATAGP